MEWIEFDLRALAKATRALAEMLEHVPPPPPHAPVPPPTEEGLKDALHRCAAALGDASMTGASPPDPLGVTRARG